MILNLEGLEEGLCSRPASGRSLRSAVDCPALGPDRGYRAATQPERPVAGLREAGLLFSRAHLSYVAKSPSRTRTERGYRTRAHSWSRSSCLCSAPSGDGGLRRSCRSPSQIRSRERIDGRHGGRPSSSTNTPFCGVLEGRAPSRPSGTRFFRSFSYPAGTAGSSRTVIFREAE